MFDSTVTLDPCGSQVKLSLSLRPLVSGRRVETFFVLPLWSSQELGVKVSGPFELEQRGSSPTLNFASIVVFFESHAILSGFTL